MTILRLLKAAEPLPLFVMVSNFFSFLKTISKQFRALRYKLFFVNSYRHDYAILTILTKQLQ